MNTIDMKSALTIYKAFTDILDSTKPITKLRDEHRKLGITISGYKAAVMRPGLMFRVEGIPFLCRAVVDQFDTSFISVRVIGHNGTMPEVHVVEIDKITIEPTTP